MGQGQSATLPLKVPTNTTQAAPLSAPHTSSQPTNRNRLGSHDIVNRIASGGMGTVYLARHFGTQRTVALKLLSPHVAHDSEFIARFKREAHVVAALDHPHIVQVYDAGYADEYYYLAMEYLPYGSLKDELKRYSKSGQAISVDRVLEIARQIASALDHAHRKGLVHRDVKPSNIMRAAGDRYVLTDFGVVLDLDATRLTRSPDSIGTPEYMSPEQIEQKTIDARSDLYALGVVMYELLAGVPPFDAEQPMVVLMKHVHELPPPLAGYRSDAPKPVLKLIERMLVKDPEQRIQTAAEVVRAIEGIQGTGDQPKVIHRPRLDLKKITGVVKIVSASCKRIQSNLYRRPLITSLLSVASVITAIILAFAAISPATISPALTKLGILSNAQAGSHLGRNAAIRLPATMHFANGAQDIKMRLGPDDVFREMSSIDKGSQLYVLGRSRDSKWLQTQVPSDSSKIGWVQVSDGQLDGKITSLPVIPASPPSAARPYTATVNVLFKNTSMGAGLNAPITVQWRVQGVTSLEVEVKGMTMPGFDCPAGDMTSVRPVASVSQQFSLSIPQGSMPLAFGMPGYYLFTFYIEKTDGSKIRVMRHANVACDKQAN